MSALQILLLTHILIYLHMSSSRRWTRGCWFRFRLGFYVFYYLGAVCLFCFFNVFGVSSLVCFELSVPMQVIAWKDSLRNVSSGM